MMKTLRNQGFTLVLFITVFTFADTRAQEPFKKSIKISPVLNLGFPDSFSKSKNGFIHSYFGEDSLGLYELTYFDTAVVKISRESDFNTALKGFVAGKFAGDGFKPYDLRLTDTLIGNLPGFFINGSTDDTLQEVREFDCFVTIANSHNYWFFKYPGTAALPAEKAAPFFASIQFDRSKIKEASFKINRFKKHKAAGATWYYSPELDDPMPPKETKKEKQVTSSYPPPPPPPPPIDPKWLVKATKLASDYSVNRALADKKYKKYNPMVVEGIIKEIKETDENGITIIILNGAPSKIDVQCEVINRFKIKNLKKGMKATFDARCNGINGNVILSRCLYIENPVFE